MRVAVVAACPFPFPRGTPIRVARLSEALARRDHDVHVVTYHLGDGAPGDGVRVSRIPRVRLYRRTSPGPSWSKLLVLDPLLARSVRDVLRRERPDLIHAHHYEGLLAALAARGRDRIPLVYDAHTLLASELPHGGMLPGRALRRSVGAFLDRRLLPLADAVTCVNDELRDAIQRIDGRDGEGRVVTVEGGVELDRFGPGRPGSGDPTHGPRLVFAGNLAPYQGIELLIEAFALVTRRAPGARLLFLLSSGNTLGRHEALAASRGVRDRVDVERVGFEDLPGRLAGADVALHPRPACAGTPIKLLNYMAAALPIVSFEGSAKGLTHGEHALLVEDGDVAGFADAALTLAADAGLARRLGDAARRRAEERHSWEASGEALEGVFLRLADAR